MAVVPHEVSGCRFLSFLLHTLRSQAPGGERRRLEWTPRPFLQPGDRCPPLPRGVSRVSRLRSELGRWPERERDC
ncbi:hypothetical protein MC885_006351 [Smutsia gigantea]|nr:hypothetical protein MC885_006351 [Smutsia gigantea]